MPQLDFAFLCDHVRAETGVMHVIAGAIDTIYAPSVAAGPMVGGYGAPGPPDAAELARIIRAEGRRP